jgi:hypothetical protein
MLTPEIKVTQVQRVLQDHKVLLVAAQLEPLVLQVQRVLQDHKVLRGLVQPALQVAKAAQAQLVLQVHKDQLDYKEQQVLLVPEVLPVHPVLQVQMEQQVLQVLLDLLVLQEQAQPVQWEQQVLLAQQVLLDNKDTKVLLVV